MAVLVAHLCILFGAAFAGYVTYVDTGVQTTEAATTVFLDIGATDQQLADIERRVEALPHVTVAETRTSEQALAEAKKLFAENPEIIDNLPGNPFPASITIDVDEDHLDAAIASIEALPGVDLVEGDG